MSTGKRKVIIIDGSNFYYKLKDLNLQNQLIIDFRALGKHISGSGGVNIYYHVGAVRYGSSIRSRRLHAQQQRLLAYLKKNEVTYVLGYLLKSDGFYHEKGVDVKMATDILLGACQDKYDQAFLVSSDSDLVPAIEGAQRLGKMVVYVGFKHMPSYALLKACKRSILLTKEDLLPLINKG